MKIYKQNVSYTASKAIVTAPPGQVQGGGDEEKKRQIQEMEKQAKLQQMASMKTKPTRSCCHR
jgi:hypothetical protein